MWMRRKKMEFALAKIEYERAALKLQAVTENYRDLRNCLLDGYYVLDYKKGEVTDFFILCHPERRTLLLSTSEELRLHQWTGKLEFSTIGRYCIELQDFQVTSEDVGCGSWLMECFIRYLKANQIHRVVGIIAPTDSDHDGKLKHFYEKFGFRITRHLGETRILLKL